MYMYWYAYYCKFGNFREGFIFVKLETSHMRSFVKIKSLRNDEIILAFIDIGKSCPSHEFLRLQICHLMLFAKNKILAKISGFTVSQIWYILWWYIIA